MVYLDNAATTYPKPPEVYDAVDEFNRKYTFNSSRGNYTGAYVVSNMINETRELMLKLVNAEEDIYETIFTPSATIALNMVLQGLDYNKVKNVYISPFEHNSVLRVLYSLQKNYNFDIIQLSLLSAYRKEVYCDAGRRYLHEPRTFVAEIQ